MPIVAFPVLDLSPRENVLASIAMLIDEAADSPEDVMPHEIADEILAFIEGTINSVGHDGNVIYRL